LKEHHINPENELIVRLQKDETRAFEALFHLYKKRVKGFVHKMLPPHISSDNVVMEVFIKVWLKRHTIDTTKSFSSFLFVIAKNQVLDELKAAVNQRIIYCEMTRMENLAPQIGVEESNAELLELKLQKAVEKMPCRRKEIFSLSRFEGLSYRQIAEKLGVTENTVDTQIRKSLLYLRQEFNNLL
jgi:RNA polymerase sigma-70 factor (ECF subfamily)